MKLWDEHSQVVPEMMLLRVNAIADSIPDRFLGESAKILTDASEQVQGADRVKMLGSEMERSVDSICFDSIVGPVRKERARFFRFLSVFFSWLS